MKYPDKKIHYLVVKDNDLIRHARYNLTTNQQRLIAYLISKIKPEDKELKTYTISISDYCALCGIDRNYFYSDIRDIIDNLDKKAFWVETPEKVFKFRWFSEVEIVKRSGQVKLRFNSNLKEYLIGLEKGFTAYELYNVLGLKSKYAFRLYEWFKSYSFQHEKEIQLEELKTILNAESYTDFRNFRRVVLETAITEINEYTDLEVSYDKKRTGKTISSLKFYISKKEWRQSYNAYLKTLMKINRENKQIEGQIGLFDKKEEEFK